jgi:ABC-2 type transport system permease protein
MGNIVFILLTPLTYIQFFIAFLIASIVRGLFVGLAIYLLAIIYIDLPLMHPWFIVSFSILGGALLGTFGILAGIWADRFDQMAAFQNFVIMPLSFLSGVFYSIHSLPPVWQSISKFNPFFYMIDGFRYGFFWPIRHLTIYKYGYSTYFFYHAGQFINPSFKNRI